MDQRLSEITKEMEEVALYAASIAIDKISADGTTTPFLVIVPSDEGKGAEQERLVLEFPGLGPDETLAAVREAVRDQRNHTHLYAFGYDGYVRANGTEIDAIVVEFAENTSDVAHAIGLPYDGEGDSFMVEEQATYLGACPSHFFLAELQ